MAAESRISTSSMGTSLGRKSPFSPHCSRRKWFAQPRVSRTVITFFRLSECVISVRGFQGGKKFVQIAVHERREVVEIFLNPMICEAVLGEVIRSDFF